MKTTISIQLNLMAHTDAAVYIFICIVQFVSIKYSTQAIGDPREMDIVRFTVKVLQLVLLVLTFHFQLITLTVAESVSDPKNHKLKSVTTENGCPFAWDMGKYGYVYGKPQICNSLLPPPLNNGNGTAEAPRQLIKSDLVDMEFIPEIEDGPSVYYTVTIDPFRKIVPNATGVIIKVQKLNPNGKHGTPVGHFDIEPKDKSRIKGYCCGNSKFYTLAYFKIQEHDRNQLNSPIKVHWYPMNFKEGLITIKGNVFTETSYWKVRSFIYKIPLILATATESGEE